MTRPAKWLIGAAGALALVAAVDFCASLAMKSRRVSRALTARLEAAFGRPVQVGQYDFSLWGGPRIEADSVTVGEDPRFGNEYFLRAQQVTATLRWQSLLLGRIAFGTFSLEGPSLNVVTAEGRWNLADWLPQRSAGSAGAGGRSSTPQLYRIEIDNGRIDFKRGTLKLPFALVDVSGRVDESGPGRWAISLEAEPLRAAVNLQDAGTLRLSGKVGGTSVRLRPANLELQWEDASLSDVLRLITGSDYGIRGRQNLDLRASSTGTEWSFELDAHDRGVHRWDLVSQPGNPDVNLRLAGSWSPGQGRLRITGGRIEGPQSLIAVAGEARWPVGPAGGQRSGPAARDVRLDFTSDGVGMQDLLAWYRSLHSGIANSLQAGGWLQGSMELSGWPPRVTGATLSGDGLRVEGTPLQAPVTFSLANFRVGVRKIALSLHAVDFGSRVGEFQITGSAQRGRDCSYRLEAVGSTPHIGALVRSVQTLGAKPLGYWSQFSGGAKVRLQWDGRLFPFGRHVRASMDFHDALWNEPTLPARVRLTNVRALIDDGRLRFDVASATTLGGTWSGWLQRAGSVGPWQFDLQADRLDARALAARLNPQPERPGLLERIFGFGRAAGPRASWLVSLDASGHLAVRSLRVDPLELSNVDGDLSVRDGVLEFSHAEARLSRGSVRGIVRLSVANRVPAWRVNARLEAVELAGISRALAGADGRFSGLASGTIDLAARGATALALRDSLRGSALLSLRAARDSRIDWLATLEDGHLVKGRSAFRSASVGLQMAGGKVSFKDVTLSGPEGRVEATGDIDLARGGALAVEARLLRSSPGRDGRGSEPRIFQVTGSAETPRIHLRAAAVPAPTTSVPQPH